MVRTAFLALLSVLSLSRTCLAFTPAGPKPKPAVKTAQNFFGGSKAEAVDLASFQEDVVAVPALQPLSDGVSDAMILGLRVGTCALMFHHGLDKIQHVDGFTANVVDKYFGFLPGPGKFWTLSAAATQIAGAGLLSVGVLARPVALSMMATMVTAVAFHLLNTGGEGFPLGVPAAHSYNFELAAMYVAVLAYFSAAGAGAYSVDEKVLGGELQFYEGLWEKAFGGED